MRKGFKTLSDLKAQVGNGILWLHELENEPCFSYGKRAQIG